MDTHSRRSRATMDQFVKKHLHHRLSQIDLRSDSNSSHVTPRNLTKIKSAKWAIEEFETKPNSDTSDMIPSQGAGLGSVNVYASHDISNGDISEGEGYLEETDLSQQQHKINSATRAAADAAKESTNTNRYLQLSKGVFRQQHTSGFYSTSPFDSEKSRKGPVIGETVNVQKKLINTSSSTSELITTLTSSLAIAGVRKIRPSVSSSNLSSQASKGMPFTQPDQKEYQPPFHGPTIGCTESGKADGLVTISQLGGVKSKIKTVASSAGLLKHYTLLPTTLAHQEPECYDKDESNWRKKYLLIKDDLATANMELALLRRSSVATVPISDYEEVSTERDKLLVLNNDLQQRLEVAEAVEDRLTLGDELEKKRIRVLTLEGELTLAKRVIADLGNRLDKLEHERREEDVKALKETLDRTSIELAEVRHSFTNLEASHRPCERIIKQLEKKIENLEHSERVAREAAERSLEQYRQLDVKQIEYEVIARELRERLSAAENRYSSLRNGADREGLHAREKLSAAHSQLLLAEQELETMRRTTQTAQVELASANSAQVAISNQLQVARNMISKLEQNVNDQKLQIEQLQSYREEQLRVYKQAMQKLEEKSEEVYDMKHSLDAVTSELNDALHVISQECAEELERKIELESLVSKLEQHQSLLDAGSLIRSEALMRVVIFCTSLDHLRTQTLLQVQKLSAPESATNGEEVQPPDSDNEVSKVGSTSLQVYLHSLLDKATSANDASLSTLLLESLTPYYKRVRSAMEKLNSAKFSGSLEQKKSQIKHTESNAPRKSVIENAVDLLRTNPSHIKRTSVNSVPVDNDEKNSNLSLSTMLVPRSNGERSHTRDVAASLKDAWNAVGEEFQILLVQRADIALRRFLQRWRRQVFAHRPTRIELEVSTSVAAVELITNWTQRLGELSSAGATQIVARLLAKRSRDLVRAFSPDLGLRFSQGPAPGLIVVSSVDPGSGAELAGICSGDVIISINGVGILTPEDARRVVRSLTPGKVVPIVCVEGGRAILTSSSDSYARTTQNASRRNYIPGVDANVISATVAAISAAAQEVATSSNSVHNIRRIQAQLISQQVSARALATVDVVVGTQNCGTHFMQRVRLFANGHVTMMDVKRYLVEHRNREEYYERELLKAQGLSKVQNGTKDSNIYAALNGSLPLDQIIDKEKHDTSDFNYGLDSPSIAERKEDETFLFGDEPERQISLMVAADQTRYLAEQCERAGLLAAWGRRRAQVSSQVQLLEMAYAVDIAEATRLKDKKLSKQQSKGAVNENSNLESKTNNEQAGADLLSKVGVMTAASDANETTLDSENTNKQQTAKKSTSESQDYLSFPQPSVFKCSVTSNADIYLGGSCDPTTWRRDIAIPVCERKHVTYYNPQIPDWSPEMVSVEAKAKEESSILFFVIDNKTRAIGSMLEASEFIARGRTVILVIQPIITDSKGIAKVNEDVLTANEIKDLNRARSFLQDLALRHGVAIFTGENAILEAILEATRRCGDVVDLSLGTERDIVFEKASLL